MTWGDLVNDLKLYSVIMGFVGFVFCLYGVFVWDMQNVVYSGGGVILACCGCGLLTKWEERNG